MIPRMVLNHKPVMIFCPLTAVLKQIGLVLLMQASLSWPSENWKEYSVKQR